MITLPVTVRPRCSDLPTRCERLGIRVAGALVAASLAVTTMTGWWFVESLRDSWVTLDPAEWGVLAGIVALLGIFCLVALRAVGRRRGRSAAGFLVAAGVVSWFLTFYLVLLTDPLGL